MVTCGKWTPVISYPTKIKSELCASVAVIGSSNRLSWQLCRVYSGFWVYIKTIGGH